MIGEFVNFLQACGFDRYGHIDDDRLESNLETIYVNNEHAHYFENEIFILLPYYCGKSPIIKSKPNFVYKPTDLRLYWDKKLKHVYSNQKIDNFIDILRACESSIARR